MEDERFDELIGEAVETARQHIVKHWTRSERPCIITLLDRIESELRLRSIERLSQGLSPRQALPPRSYSWPASYILNGRELD